MPGPSSRTPASRAVPAHGPGAPGSNREDGKGVPRRRGAGAAGRHGGSGGDVSVGAPGGQSLQGWGSLSLHPPLLRSETPAMNPAGLTLTPCPWGAHCTFLLVPPFLTCLKPRGFVHFHYHLSEIEKNFLTASLCCVSQSYLTLCDPENWSPPDSAVHGISQARILE